MEKKIKEIQNYFMAKLLAGDFRVIKVKEHTLDLIVDEKYSFTIWVANTPISRKLYEYTTQFISLSFTQKQSTKLNSVLRPFTDKYKEEVLLAGKRAQLEQLKKELGEK